ncbi:protein asteroid homolog 1-like, partial [Achroia grisella]|uniref:protein asteroid homolog 1-like n=1 Tax=Achroia grisella TaxID=688607 RepID=UPI0027D21C36
MRIKGFGHLIQNESSHHQLKNCSVVIDGQNFFYNQYRDSKLPFVYGCESDKYAKYLRSVLSMFKRANVKCYFIFKGGHMYLDIFSSKNYFNWESKDVVLPIFMKDVYKQVLDEMDMEYSISRFEAKDDVIAFAKRNNCCILSNDIEFSFSGLPYVNYTTIAFNQKNNAIECKLFVLDNFLDKYNLNRDKIAIFITLTDITIFEEFFFDNLRQDWADIERNTKLIFLLNWLADTSVENMFIIINEYLSRTDQLGFLEEYESVRRRVLDDKTGRLCTMYLENRNNVVINEKDPDWFEKGVALGHVAIPYVNLYHHKQISGSWAIEGDNNEDGLRFSIDILQYAFNLLTNYEKDEFIFINKHGVPETISTENALVMRPEYAATVSPFENGWGISLKNLKLFEHFVENSLAGFNFNYLQELPENVRLVVISLIYFSCKSPSNTTDNIVHSVLLSYIAVGLLSHDNNRVGQDDSPVFSEADVDAAMRTLANFFRLPRSEARDIYRDQLLHPLVQFQFCLNHLNYLNKLC